MHERPRRGEPDDGGARGGAVTAVADAGGRLDAYVREVEALVSEQLVGGHAAPVLRTHEGVVVDEVRRLALGPGKRIRPRLVRAGYGAAGGADDARDVVVLGAALELYHCALLIHDDVIDGADLRRGVPTSHRWWCDEHRAQGWVGDPEGFGRSVALLAGHLALAVADAMVVDLPAPVRRLWSAMKAATVVGEFAELYATVGRLDGPDVMAEVARLKTARYTVADPLAMGATLAGRHELAGPFGAFGAAVGEAYQLLDDLLDATATSAETLKSTGVDGAAGRSTLLLAHLVATDAEVAAAPDVAARHAVAHERLRDPAVLTGVRAAVDGLLGRGFAVLDGAGLEPGWDAELRAVARRLGRPAGA